MHLPSELYIAPCIRDTDEQFPTPFSKEQIQSIIDLFHSFHPGTTASLDFKNHWLNDRKNNNYFRRVKTLDSTWSRGGERETFICLQSSKKGAPKIYLLKKPVKAISEVTSLNEIEQFASDKQITLKSKFLSNGDIFQRFASEGDLQGYFYKRKGSGKPLTAEEHRNFSIQILEKIDQLYDENICHHDIKPDNILVDLTSAETTKIYLTDFGLSKKYPRTADLSPIARYGSIYYAPPELLTSDQKISDQKISANPYKADLFSLGHTLYFLCTGSHLSLSFNPAILLGKLNNKQSLANYHEAIRAAGNNSEEIQKVEQKQNRFIELYVQDKSLREIIIGMLRILPENRMSVKEALQILKPPVAS
ncbi:MAG: protein kinase domain-containing protein [Chlamydiia bacterium]